MKDRPSSLASRSRHAVFWSASEAALRLGLTIVVTVVLAHLITPAQFGVFSMVLVFTTLANVLSDFGLSPALIQKRDATAIDESTSFFFNVGLGVFASIALALSAPLIASFYDQPVLIGVARVVAISLTFSSLGSIHATLLRKSLNIRPLVWITMCSSGLSGALAIFLALRGFGVWSLAWQSVARSVITSTLFWITSTWRPALQFSISSLRSLLRFGGPYTATGVMNAIYDGTFPVLVGRLYGASSAGYYMRAFSTQQIPSATLWRIFVRVTFPAFAEASTDAFRLRRAFTSVLQAVTLVNVPIAVVMMVGAEPLVSVVFGPQWAPSAPLLKVLSFLALVYPINNLNVNVLSAQGHSHLVLRLTAITKLIGVVSLAVASPWGLLAMAWSQVLSTSIALFVNTYYTRRFLNFGLVRQLRTISQIAIAGAVSAVVVLVTAPVIEDDRTIQLIVMLCSGMLGYVICAWLLGELSRERINYLLGR